MTLLTAANPALRKPLAQAALVLTGSLMIGLAAQISVPMFPVPMTLQTLAICIIGLTYGSRLAGLTLLAYLAEGAMGLPVFANGGFGLAKLIGPTSGFLWGFVAMAWMIGYLVERGLNRGVLRLFAAAVIPAMLLYIPGTLGLMAFLGKGAGDVLALAVTPFVPGDILKPLIAAMAVAGAWTLINRR